jgi:hypothetical protein
MMKRKIASSTLLSLIMLLSVFAETAFGQQQTFPALFTNKWCQGDVAQATEDPDKDAANGFAALWKDFKIAENKNDEAKKTEARRLIGFYLNANQQAGCVADLILRADTKVANQQLVSSMTAQFVSAVEKQAGSAVSSSGTTNVISKNLTSSLLSVASEYGALTSSTSGQTTTVSGTLDQLLVPFEKSSNGLISDCAVALIKKAACVNSALLDVLGKVSYSASLDASQPSTITGTATGQAMGGTQQVTGTQGSNNFSLSQFTAKFLVYAHKPSPSDFKSEADTDKLTFASTSTIAALRSLQNSVKGDGWTDWLTKAVDALLSSDETHIADEMTARIKLLIQLLSTNSKSGKEEEVVSTALGVAAAEANDAASERTVYDKALWKKPLVSLEYDFNSPANQPSNSAFGFIYGQSFKRWKVTVNAGASIYNSTPSQSIPGAEKLRYAQVGAEGDYTIPVLGKLDSSSLSLAYYFQNQTSPSILNVTPSSPLSGISFSGLSSSATQVFTQAGQIHLGQLKLTLGNSSSGFSLPISVTASNRTELIDENKILIRPQVGINYSFDSLLHK